VNVDLVSIRREWSDPGSSSFWLQLRTQTGSAGLQRLRGRGDAPDPRGAVPRDGQHARQSFYPDPKREPSHLELLRNLPVRGFAPQTPESAQLGVVGVVVRGDDRAT
jgi:hypothetical protein